MKHYSLSALVALTLTSSAFGCGADGDYVGSICTTAATYCPVGTLEANGQILQVTQYQALFSLLYNTYGGDGKVNFALPDLRGRAPVGLSYNVPSPAGQPVSLGTKRGAETVTLTTAQMPQHIHAAAFNPGNGTNPITVTVPVSANTNGNKLTPDSTYNTLAGTISGLGSAAMWTNTMTSPVTINGVTVSGDTNSGTVSLTTTGAAAPVSVLPPQLGLKYCVVYNGIYPMRP